MSTRPIDTLIIVGEGEPEALLATVLTTIKLAAAGTRRVASVCTGVAGKGGLDGRRATTHWRSAARLQQAYPGVHVEADRIFIRDGKVWTSAGTTAGIDLALVLIEDDLGSNETVSDSFSITSVII